MRAHLFVNPISGRGRAKAVLPAVMDRLERSGAKVTVVLSKVRGDLIEAARALPSDADAAVILGGDGTMNEVANGLAGRDLPVGIIPLGVGNVMAKEYDIPYDPEAAADVILGGRTVRIDVGLMGDRRFLLMAGAGLDAEVVRRLHEGREGPVHMLYLRYVRIGLGAVAGYRFPPFELELDGKIFARDVRMVVVGNTRSYGGPFEFTPRASAEDSLFDVCAISSPSGPAGWVGHARSTLAFFWEAMRGRLLGIPGVTYGCGRTVRILGDGIPVQVDGEVAGKSPAEFRLLPRAFPLIVPQA